MSEAVICEPLRNADGCVRRRTAGRTGTGPGGDGDPRVDRAHRITADQIDDAAFGHCYPTMDAPAIGRVAALDAGLEVTVPGVQVDRRCGSGLQAVLYAAMAVRTGGASLVLAGGAESMSGTSCYSTAPRWGTRAGGFEMKDALAEGRVHAGGRDTRVWAGMIETAGNVRTRYSIGREEQDRLAARSHEKAIAAIKDGRFADELVPVTVPGRKSDTIVEADEHVRPDAALDSLAKLRPITGRQDPDATVTAGNASGQNDLATMLREMDRRQARYDLETMCIGRGQGLAAIFERVT
jgi:acetyl-CoA C-acetyltransferase